MQVNSRSPFRGVANASNTPIGLAHGGGCDSVGTGARGGAGQAAGRRASFHHPVDRRQAWRLLDVGRRRRYSHGSREHEPARSGVRARLERESGSRRPAIVADDSRRDAAGRRGRDLHDQRWDGGLEESRRCGYRELCRPRVLRVARRTDRHDGLVPRSAAGEARQVARPPARRQSPRGKAGRSRRRRRYGEADDHALVHHRHQHLAAADLGRREQQVLRADLRDRLAAGDVCRRTEENRGCAGRRHGGAGARVGQGPGHRARGAGRVHRRPAVRRRRAPVPRRPDGDRGQGRDYRCRRAARRSRCRPTRR